MLSRPGSRSRRSRAIAATGALALIVPLLGMGPPAGAAPGDGVPSAIGDGGSSDPSEYIREGTDLTGDVDIEIGPERDDACRQVGGAVSLADIAAALGSAPPPQGEGQWIYQLCAQDGTAAARIAAERGSVANMKQHCAQPANRCGLFVTWRPEIEDRPPANIRGNTGLFRGYIEFTPELETSPKRDLPYGLVVRFPIWMWDINNNFPKPIHLPVFGGITGVAFHLETEWETDGRRVCDDSGTPYRPGRHAPDQPSPDCGHVYQAMGEYEIEGCKTWLVIAQLGGLFPVPIVFPITLCDQWTVPVKESQVVTGSDPRRAPAR